MSDLNTDSSVSDSGDSQTVSENQAQSFDDSISSLRNAMAQRQKGESSPPSQQSEPRENPDPETDRGNLLNPNNSSLLKSGNNIFPEIDLMK